MALRVRFVCHGFGLAALNPSDLRPTTPSRAQLAEVLADEHPERHGDARPWPEPTGIFVCTGERPQATQTFKEMATMSGCYSDYNDCNEQSWDYNDCYKPRHRRHHRRYDNCWDYSPSYCN
jgi:hypothetical protein